MKPWHPAGGCPCVWNSRCDCGTNGNDSKLLQVVIHNAVIHGGQSGMAPADTRDSGLRRSVAVGLYPRGSSPQPVRDLAGNVWEWCVNSDEQLRGVSVVLKIGVWARRQ